MGTRPRSASPLTRALITELAAIRAHTGRRDRRRRRRLLDRIAAATLDDPRLLRDLHEQLLFAVTYPDSRAMLARGEGQLRRLARACAAQYRVTPSVAARVLDDTGIAGSRVRASFSIDVLHWLVNRYGSAVDIDWDDHDTRTAVEDLLGLISVAAESDGLLAREVTTQVWVRGARGLPASRGRRNPEPPTDLAWLLRHLGRVDARGRTLDLLLEAKGVGIRWHLRGSRGSRTFQRFPLRPLFIGQALVRSVDAPRIINEPLNHVRLLPRPEAGRVIDVARAALAVRARETDPVTYATAAEVTMIRLERGIDIALIGMRPDRRQPLESYFGYVAARNRVPVAYGGGWVFLNQCEIGINVFDTFRGGESAYLFAQILRVYRQHFNVATFVVDPFQIGDDNPEAITSGAFWFYMRLGFRPHEPALAALAQREWAALQANPAYRCSRTMLRRLAKSTMILDLAPPDGTPAAHAPLEAPQVRYVGLAVTEFVSHRFGGDRDAAERACARGTAGILGVRGMARRPAEQRRAFERWSVLAAMIGGLNHWPGIDKRKLAQLMFAKGGLRERPHALALRGHRRLCAALAAIDARGRAIASGEAAKTAHAAR